MMEKTVPDGIRQKGRPTKAEKYMKKNPGYNFYLVDKRFGNGRQLIQFFYRDQLHCFNQGFLAYVDSQRWKYGRHEVMDEVEKYLCGNTGAFDYDDFREVYRDDVAEGYTTLSFGEYHDRYFEGWLEEQFPMIDLHYGGVCYFDAV